MGGQTQPDPRTFRWVIDVAPSLELIVTLYRCLDRRPKAVGLSRGHFLWKRGYQAPTSHGERTIPEHQHRVFDRHEEGLQVPLRPGRHESAWYPEELGTFGRSAK